MIGLDTGHLVYNYGTKLQAYAMQTLLSRTGESVEIIQWHQKDFKILNGLADFARSARRIQANYGWKYWKLIFSRYKALDQFNKKFHIHKFYGTFEDMQRNMKIYDSVFCGSDQAWLPGNVKHHWYTLEYCPDASFKAAYAPSFGIENIEEELKEQYRDFLMRFNALSVREISGQKIIQDLTGRQVPVVLDPTLLLCKDDWDGLKNEHTVQMPFQGEYIFCYFLGGNKQHRDSVKKLSQVMKKKIVNLAHFSGYCQADTDFADLDLYQVSPQDFIYLIENAAYVCTDSFHCTAFSIQYHKNFTVYQRFKSQDGASTNTRLFSLLGQLKLQNRIVSDDQNVNFEDIDYRITDEILETLRKDSEKYLMSALRKESNV